MALRKNVRNKRLDLQYILFIFLTVIGVYWQVYKFKFLVGWDDQWFVINHYTSDGFTVLNIRHILRDYFLGQYAPVNQLYYTLIYSVFGYDPRWFHTGSLIIHLINSTLVFLVTTKILNFTSKGDNINIKFVAFITALLFAISPINIESVAWISASKVLLYALFYLSSLHCYLKYILEKKLKYYFFTIAFFLLSFGSKEQAVTLPVCLLLFDFLSGKRLDSKALWLEKSIFIVLSIVFCVVSIRSQDIDASETNFYHLSDRIILAFYTFSDYLTKCVLPVNLSYLYPFPFKNGAPVPLWLLTYPIVLLTAIFSFRKFYQTKWLIFGVVFFTIHIVLVINLVSLARHSLSADRYVYISSVGIYFLLAYITVILIKIFNKKWIFRFLGMYCLYFITYSYSHLNVWRDAKELKRNIRETIQHRKDYPEWETKERNNAEKI
jgi:hypothetical protein